jgi:hypothetical protein
MDVLPELAVALKPPSVPWFGAAETDQVSVLPGVASDMVSRLLIAVAAAYWHDTNGCGLAFMKTGLVVAIIVFRYELIFVP